MIPMDSSRDALDMVNSSAFLFSKIFQQIIDMSSCPGRDFKTSRKVDDAFIDHYQCP